MPSSIALWNQLSMYDKVWYDARVMAATFLESLAPAYRPESNIIFDLNTPLTVNDVQDSVTKVMGNVFENSIELGGRTKDVAVIHHAHGLQNLVRGARHRYYRYATAFQIRIRTVLILTVLLSVIQAHLDDVEAETTFEILKGFNIALPLIESALLGFEAGFRPSSKYASLLLAEKRIESEILRFKRRTGLYRYRGGYNSDDKHAREAFSEQIQSFWRECMHSDVFYGSLFLSAAKAKNLNKVCFGSQAIVKEGEKDTEEREPDGSPNRISRILSHNAGQSDQDERWFGWSLCCRKINGVDNTEQQACRTYGNRDHFALCTICWCYLVVCQATPN